MVALSKPHNLVFNNLKILLNKNLHFRHFIKIILKYSKNLRFQSSIDSLKRLFVLLDNIGGIDNEIMTQAGQEMIYKQSNTVDLITDALCLNIKTKIS